MPMADPEKSAPEEPAPQEIDLRGLRCPLPVIRMGATARRLPPGTRLRVLTDDPLARLDVPHALRQAGHACRELPSPDDAECVFEVTLAR